MIWGLYHGTFLVLERLAPALTRQAVSIPGRAVRHAYVLLTVIVGWVFFRADSLAHAVSFLGAMAGLGGTAAAGLRAVVVSRSARR